MKPHPLVLFCVLFFVCRPTAASASEAIQTAQSPNRLVLVVPVRPGGGLDDIGRAVQKSLLDGKFVDTVTIEHLPGAHGTVGLREFLKTHTGDPHALLVAGRTLIEARSVADSVSQLVPIARLAGEFEVIAVPAVGDDIQSFDSMVRALREKPGSLPHVAMNDLTSQGVNPALANWRGLFAAPGLSADQRKTLEAMISAMTVTRSWQEQMTANHWTGDYLAGEQFATMLAEHRAVADAAVSKVPRKEPTRLWQMEVWSLEHRRELLVGCFVIAVGLYLRFRHLRDRVAQREFSLHQELQVVRENVTRISAEKEQLLKGVSEQIEGQFQRWGFTEAEREVAMLMLKGLRHKEIADVRGTTERTVRQQAVVIYKKAGISGRTDLAAYFLEDLLQPWSPPHSQ